MTAAAIPPPEAVLIARMRERAPRISMAEAARRSGISPTRWRQIENGFRPFRGVRYPETGPAQTIAKMALAVDVTPAQLREAGRGDAAAELEAMIEDLGNSGILNGRQATALSARVRRDLA